MSESQPLLDTKRTPLPIRQISLLYLTRITDPICFCIVFPFINQMLLDIGAVGDSSEAGYYAGMVRCESLCILLNLTGRIVFFVCSTFDDISLGETQRQHRSQTSASNSERNECFSKANTEPIKGLRWVVHCVCLVWIQSRSSEPFHNTKHHWRNERQPICPEEFNVSVDQHSKISANLRSSESTDETNSARAFSFWSVCVNLGTIIASLIGGSLTNTRLPIPVLQSYPYLLPMLISAIFPAMGFILSLFYLDETLQHSDDSKKSDTTSIRQLLTTRVSLIMFNFAMLSLMGVALLALLPLFCFTPISQGGLGMNPQQIGWIISGRSITNMAIQLLLFPTLQQRAGTVRLYKWLTALWIPCFVTLPLAQVFARTGSTIGVNMSLIAFLIIGAVAGMSVGQRNASIAVESGKLTDFFLLQCATCCSQMRRLLHQSYSAQSTVSDEKRCRQCHANRMHAGISQMISSSVGIFGPTGSTALFAVSIAHGVAGGNLVWIVTVVFASLAFISSFLIDDRMPESRLHE